jgi:hypothetical protein
MKEGKMIFGEVLDYEDIKHISGAIYAGRRNQINFDELDPNSISGI